VLLDDRDERPGVKFKDADLVGIPYRINVGKKLVEGQVELFTRQTSSKVDILKDSVVQHLHAILTQPKPASINDAGNGFSS
jgi:prolyl-tRNA synthetase